VRIGVEIAFQPLHGVRLLRLEVSACDLVLVGDIAAPSAVTVFSASFEFFVERCAAMPNGMPALFGRPLQRALPAAALVIGLVHHASTLAAATIVLPGSRAPSGNASVATHAPPSRQPYRRQGDVVLGVYDPHEVFDAESGVEIEHIFVFWQQLAVKSLREQLRYAHQRGRTMMVTVEPYTRAPNWRDGAARLFADIVRGEYRREISRVCSELGKFPGDVIVRWGHEMEDPTGRYPWARSDSEGFKAAYRHFVMDCRSHAPRAKFIWSPKGEKNLARYYPGSAYVDYVGVSLWGLQEMDQDAYGRAREFGATLLEKYNRVNGFGKPVIIAELGVYGDRAYRDAWFRSLYETMVTSSRFRSLHAVVYFNDKEPQYWPNGYGSPDWRIEPGWFSAASTVRAAAAERPQVNGAELNRHELRPVCTAEYPSKVDIDTTAC
jgi:beta-mannanase